MVCVPLTLNESGFNAGAEPIGWKRIDILLPVVLRVSRVSAIGISAFRRIVDVDNGTFSGAGDSRLFIDSLDRESDSECKRVLILVEYCSMY